MGQDLVRLSRFGGDVAGFWRCLEEPAFTLANVRDVPNPVILSAEASRLRLGLPPFRAADTQSSPRRSRGSAVSKSGEFDGQELGRLVGLIGIDNSQASLFVRNDNAFDLIRAGHASFVFEVGIAQVDAANG